MDNPESSFESQKRLFLGMGLVFVLLMAYQFFFAPTPPPPESQPKQASADAGTTPDAGTAGTTATPPAPTAEAPAPDAVAAEQLPVQTVTRNFPDVHYTFSSEGAGLTSAVLQGPKMRQQQQLSIAQGYQRLFTGKDLDAAPQMNMAIPVGALVPLATGIEGASPFAPTARYRLVEGADAEKGKLTFVARQGPWEITKTIDFPREDGLELDIAVTVKNVSSQPAQGELSMIYPRRVDPNTEEEASFFGGLGNQAHVTCYVGEDVERKLPDDEPTHSFAGPVHFGGLDLQYFLGAVFPKGKVAPEGKCVTRALPTERIVSTLIPVSLQPGQSVTQSYGAWIGPKDPEVLANVSAAVATSGFASPELQKSVDFGIWEVIAKLLLWVMKLFHQLIGNWGIAVICLTITIKVVLLPLQHKSMVSMEAMKKLQPKLEAIKKKYPEDRERQQLETMKMYQEAKVNPLAGCLPMLIQMPVWIALFQALRHSYDLYNEPFISPVWTDLTFKDPTYLLPIALGVTMIITQRLQPQMVDRNQALIMTWVMPIFFTVIMLNYPMGLSLYIFTNNLLSIAQTYALRKWLAKREAAATVPALERRK